MITLNQIKLDLIKCLPKYGIRIFFGTDFVATTIINTKITIYNEKKLFGHFLTYLSSKNMKDLVIIKNILINQNKIL